MANISGQPESSIDKLGREIDEAATRGDHAAPERALQDCDALETQLPTTEAALLFYFKANIHAALYRLSRPRTTWSWSEPNREAEIFNLRKAVRHAGFEALHPVRKAQIWTNIANGLDHLGRTVEALEVYDRALTQVSRFAMALGNRGLSRYTFAAMLFDPGHMSVGMMLAHEDLEATRERKLFWECDPEEPRRVFSARAAYIEQGLDIARVRSTTNLEQWSLGKSAVEKRYRQWALLHRLFINPLNVFGPYRIGARDVMTLPAHVVDIGNPPEFIAWFNQMVQEFVSARALHFEGVHARHKHYSDRDVTLVNTLDYPAFSMAVEKVRLSFRSAYSLLDKIAGFLNAYLELGIPVEEVTVRKVWNEKKRLRQVFEDRPNLPLRGLYWLSRDVLDEHDGTRHSLDPDAENLKNLRHTLEHRCIVLREMNLRSNDMGIVVTMPWDEFQTKALRLLKLVRASLIYLSLAVRQEERDRAIRRQGRSFDAHLPTYLPMEPRFR